MLVQLSGGSVLADKAIVEHSTTRALPALRGTIFDRDGTVLARSLPTESIAAPSFVPHPHAVALTLAPLLDDPDYPVATIESKLRLPPRFRYIDRKIPYEIARRIEALKIDGIEVVPEPSGKRITPAGRLASTVIGYVDPDEKGIDGIENVFEGYLHAADGKVTVETDPRERPLPFGRTIVKAQPQPGHNLALTIDSFLQFEAEHALAEQVARSHASSGSVIIMDPWTGELLALANIPDFELAHYYRYTEDQRRDRAVVDTYEPGSTFKLVTAAAALESGKVSPQTRFPPLDALVVGGRTIHNADDGLMAASGGPETMDDIIARSHNVGAAEIGIAIGAPTLYRMIRAFGFGDLTGIELGGESGGILPPLAHWSGSSLATISFGQGIATTPLAMARAYAAIANGGLLLRPRVVRALYNTDGSVAYTYGPEIERRVISEQTARILRGYLRSVVVRGTGKGVAAVPGYTTAGKTGTAQMVENGYYAAGAYVASFIGFVPAERPRFVILVKIERPRGDYYGSTVAAPVFAKLARIAMLHAGELPQLPPSPAPGRLVSPMRASKATR